MARPGDPTPALVPGGGRFEGVVAFRGEARVDGAVEGRVEGSGRLSVGASGRIEGDVEVDALVLGGTIEGDVRVRDTATLEGGATLRGTLEAGLLEMADGAVLEGRCSVALSSGRGDPAPR